MFKKSVAMLRNIFLVFYRKHWALSIRPKNPDIPGGKSNGTEIFDKKVSKIVVYLSRLSSFSENSGTTEIEWIYRLKLLTRI